MRVPKYIEKKILKRAKLQERATILQQEIDNWCEKHNIELKYSVSHVCLFTEPMMVALHTINEIKESKED